MTTEPTHLSTERDEPAVGTTEEHPDATMDESGEADSHLGAEWFGPGWSTAKVAVLVVLVALVAAIAGAILQDRVGAPSADSVDVGFLQDMISHHEQAIQLGVIGVANAESPDVAHFALEAVVAQQYEIGYMEAILEEWGYGTGDRDRDVMAWMGMPTTLDNMPGMASAEDLDAFRSSSGSEADAAFLSLMTEHHRGGIHMADHAAERGSDDRVTSLAERMAANQAAEINEYDSVARRLGLAP